MHKENMNIHLPLAERMRPTTVKMFVGQRHLMGEGKLIDSILKKKALTSLIFWGPPGSGKTTLARLIAKEMDANFVQHSAVLAGVKDIRKTTEDAEKLRKDGIQTILMIDEIHRFNKAQQDALLPHVEGGIITLLGATTENPSFEVIPPLLSRLRVVRLNPLDTDYLKLILERAVDFYKKEPANIQINMSDNLISSLIQMVNGDARSMLTIFEMAVAISPVTSDNVIFIDEKILKEAVQSRSLLYDKAGEEHFNLISALHKSLRDSDPDGALYWAYRMIIAGETPLYILRRLIRFASEDIGMADPNALTVVVSALNAFQVLGEPEGRLAVAQAVVYLATAPKSNALYMAEKSIISDINNYGALPVPFHLRNAPTSLMKNFGYGKGYEYAHNAPDAVVNQEHFPEKLGNRTYYKPVQHGFESTIQKRLKYWNDLKEKRKAEKGK